MVTLITARINDLSKEALSSLFSCPSDTYNVEVRDTTVTRLGFIPPSMDFQFNAPVLAGGALATPDGIGRFGTHRSAFLFHYKELHVSRESMSPSFNNILFE